MALAQPCRPRCDAHRCARRPPSAIASGGAARGLSAQSLSSSSSSSSARRSSTSALARASPSDRSIASPALVARGDSHRRVPTATVPRAAASAAPSTPTTAATTETTFSFACPICHDTPFRLPAADPYASDCACPRCGRTFLVSRGGAGGGSNASSSSAFVDLTLQSGAQPQVFEQRSWVGTELFRTEAVSSIYERGWRQGFARAGFPGPQREFDLAMRYFAPVLSGSGEGAGNRPVLVDASCGTGLFTRLFARSGEFSGVVALDYSETMLRETRRLLAASR